MTNIIEVTDCNSHDFESAMQIYTDSFPTYERHSIESIKDRIQNKTTQLYVYSIDNKVLAFALLVNLKNDFVLLDYLAIRVGERKQGIGSTFIDFLLQSPKTMVLEVENPYFGDNTDIKRKRIEFYLRKGFRILDKVNYVLPPLDKVSEPTPMFIMFNTNAQLNHEMIKIMLSEIYQTLYSRDSNDLLLNTFINNIPINPILTAQI